MTGAERARRAQARTRRATVAVVVALVLITAATFYGRSPFSHPYEIRATFSSSNQLHAGSDVRIAGVNVGSVSRVSRGPHHTSLVTMRITDSGRPIRRDAQLAIKPRLVLEGNFYVAVRPGSPTAPELRAGQTIPLEQTSVPVQLDQVLDTFDAPTRGAMHRSIGELAKGLGPGPGAPAGSASLRRATRELARALPSIGTVSTAMRGTTPGDLGRAIRSSRDVTGQLSANPRSLADGVTNFNTLATALASRDRELAQSVRGLARVTRLAPAGFSALDRALPAVQRFAAGVRPGARALPASLTRANRLVAQLDGLVSARELPRLLTDAGPALHTLPGLERKLAATAPLFTHASRCLSSRVVATLDKKLADGPNSTGDPVWLDAAHAFAGAAGVVSGFDGNGVASRVGDSQSDQTLDGVIPGIGRVTGRTPELQGLRPAWLGYGVEPPYRPDAPCKEQAPPDLSLRSAPPPALPTGGRTVKVGGILP